MTQADSQPTTPRATASVAVAVGQPQPWRPDAKELSAAVVIIAALWAFGRWVFTPHLGKTVRKEFESEIAEAAAKAKRLGVVEVRVDDHEKRITTLENHLTRDIAEFRAELSRVHVAVARLEERTRLPRRRKTDGDGV